MANTRAPSVTDAPRRPGRHRVPSPRHGQCCHAAVIRAGCGTCGDSRAQRSEQQANPSARRGQLRSESSHLTCPSPRRPDICPSPSVSVWVGYGSGAGVKRRGGAGWIDYRPWSLGGPGQTGGGERRAVVGGLRPRAPAPTWALVRRGPEPVDQVLAVGALATPPTAKRNPRRHPRGRPVPAPVQRGENKPISSRPPNRRRPASGWVARARRADDAGATGTWRGYEGRAAARIAGVRRGGRGSRRRARAVIHGPHRARANASKCASTRRGYGKSRRTGSKRGARPGHVRWSGRRTAPPGPVRRPRGMRRRRPPAHPVTAQRADPRTPKGSAPTGTGAERTHRRTATRGGSTSAGPHPGPGLGTDQIPAIQHSTS